MAAIRRLHERFDFVETNFSYILITRLSKTIEPHNFIALFSAMSRACFPVIPQEMQPMILRFFAQRHFSHVDQRILCSCSPNFFSPAFSNTRMEAWLLVSQLAMILLMPACVNPQVMIACAISVAYPWPW